jgi:hypothetical protein
LNLLTRVAMEHLTALTALEHSCSLCSDRKEELRIWELRNNQNVCRRAHFLYACVNAVQPLLHNAGYADRVMEEDGIIRVKLRSYKPRNGRHYPYGCDHRVDFECLILDGPASRDGPVLCAEVQIPDVIKKVSIACVADIDSGKDFTSSPKKNHTSWEHILRSYL